MERIGAAASKIAKGSLWRYNFYVILITFLCSLFVFIIAGMTVAFALILITYVVNEVGTNGRTPLDFQFLLSVCLIALTVLMAFFYVLAISRNIKFSKPKEGA